MNLNPIPTVCLLVGLLTIPPSTGNPGSLLNQFDLLALTRPPTQSTLLISPTTSKLLPLPPLSSRSYYTSITPDPSTDKIYWSTNKGVIGYSSVNNSSLPNVIRNASSPTSIVDLTYSNSRLYWVEDDTLIKSMHSNGSDIKTLAKATPQEKIQGLTINHKTGTIYYTTWQRYHRTSGSIYTLPQTSPPTPLLTNLILPASLTISPTSSLSWISNPPSDHFTIERLNTLDPNSKKETITRQQNHGYSIASTCNGVYYTVANDKHVWSVGGKELDFGVPEHTNLSFRKVVEVPKESCPEATDTIVNVSTSSEIPSSDSPVASQEVLDQRDAPKDMVKPTTAPKTFTENSSIAILHDTPTSIPNHPTTTSAPHYPTIESTTESPNNPQLRFCTPQESETTCGTQPNSICVLISNTPVCLCQLPHCTPQSQPEHSGPSTQEPQKPTPQQPWPPESIIIISVLATLATVMSMISLYMTIRVRTLNKKPIIRRRVVVRTSESGSSTPASVCEMIDIENCCNMNVCETPCYERTLLQPSTSTPNSQSVISVNSTNTTWTGCGGPTKKEDKKCLLR